MLIYEGYKVPKTMGALTAKTMEVFTASKRNGPSTGWVISSLEVWPPKKIQKVVVFVFFFWLFHGLMGRVNNNKPSILEIIHLLSENGKKRNSKSKMCRHFLVYQKHMLLNPPISRFFKPLGGP